MATYYLSPTGNDTTGSGTIGSPWFSLNKAWTVVAAGDTIYMRGGTYTYTVQQYLTGKNGTSGNTIKIYAYTGESPVITRGVTFDKSAGWHKGMVFITANYIHVKGIRFTGMYTDDNQVDAGLFMIDVNNSTFEQIECDNNVQGLYIEGSYTGNLFLNSDFHDNYSNYSGTNGGNSDGIGLSYNTTTSSNNTVRGCRAWNNGDDGFDSFENSGYVTYDNCWSWHNGFIYGTGTQAGNGCGFKLGSDFLTTPANVGVVKRRMQNCIAWDNGHPSSAGGAAGVHINEADHSCEIYNCTFFNNGITGMNFHYNNRVHYFRNVVSFGNGSKDVEVSTNSNSSNCSYGTTGSSDALSGWTNNASTADFVSTTPTGVTGARDSSGNLPTITFLNLTTGSDLIDTGINVGLPFSGSNPDRGAFEFGTIPSNIAPTANAGVDQLIMLPNSTVTLTGSGSDSDGTIVSYAWSQISGTSATITSPSSQNTTITGLTTSGTRVFRLTVTDNLGATGTDDITITVNQNVGIMAKHLLRMGIIASSATVIGGPPPPTNPSVATMVYDSKSFNFNSQVPFARSFFLKPDGTKLYIADYFGVLNQYTLSTAGDISTASYDTVNIDLGLQGSEIFGLYFKSDGTTFWAIENENGNIRQYNMSSAWDLSTATYASVAFNILADDSTDLGDLWFKADGTKVFYTGTSTGRIFQRTLSSPWDITTAGASTFGSYAAQESGRASLSNISSDGTVLQIIGVDMVTAFEYTLSTPFDVSTLVYSTQKDVSAQSFGEVPTNFRVLNGKAYINMGQIIYQYSIS